jgi:L-amino acid N-acyltransferase YncA
LYAIYLLEQAQRQGVGKALLKELAESRLGEGFTGMIVWILEKESFATPLCEIERADRHNQERPNRGCDAI